MGVLKLLAQAKRSSKSSSSKNGRGFTIIELVISVALFALIATAVIGVYSALSNVTKKAREKTIVASLANNYMEIVRNLSYSQVGTVSGNPNGSLPDLSNATTTSVGVYSFKIFYEVTYIDDPADGTAPADVAAADYKQVKLTIQNTATGVGTNFVTNVVPQGLEGTNNAGALLIKVFDANGQPLPGANIHITYPTTTPTMVFDRTSDANGQWIEVGLPAAAEQYRIVVTKSGYSTDRTYPRTASNPNPVKPDATIVVGQVTSISFSIDLLSNLTVRTLDQYCQPVNNVALNIVGAKLIGTDPNVLKFNQNFSSGPSQYPNGQIALTNLEWDTYTPTLLTGQSWIVRGTSPIQKIDVLPGASQVFTMILDTYTTANSILIIVKDAATGAPIEGATVQLQKGGSQPPPFQQGAYEQYYTGITGGSVWVQNDWSGGPNLDQWSTSTPDQYYQSDGNVSINNATTGIQLKKVSGDYQPSAWLESSTFDTGTSNTNFTTITWEPTSQSAGTELKFQVAANNDNATWNYIGPDGTDSTYYTVSGTSISSALNNNRYFRYKVFLSTTNRKKTPVLTSLNINYVSGCYTPGQVMFKDLTSGNNYDVGVDMPGYQSFIENNITITGNKVYEVLMSP